MRLNFMEWPNPQSSNGNLLFLHGMGGTARIWNPIATRLQPDFHCIAFDQRGHGGSQKPPDSDWTPLAYGRDVIETLDTLPKTTPCIGIGHSMGVRSLIAAAHLRPELFSHLVLIDLGFTGLAGGGFGERLYQFLSVLPDHYPDRASARADMSARSPDAAITAYLLAVSKTDPDTGVLSFPFAREALLKTIESARDFSIRPWVLELAEMGKPILALRGGTSTVWSAKEFEEEKARFSAFSNITFETVEGTGHGLPFEKRVLFCDRLKSWVA